MNNDTRPELTKLKWSIMLDPEMKREMLEDAADLKAALRARKEKGGVPWERVKAKLAARRAAAAKG